MFNFIMLNMQSYTTTKNRHEPDIRFIWLFKKEYGFATKVFGFKNLTPIQGVQYVSTSIVQKLSHWKS